MFLPSKISNLITLSSLEAEHIGESKSDVFKVRLARGGIGYLKISSSSYVKNEIRREIQVLDWLKPFINVPELIEVIEEGQSIFFLMTAIEGKNLAEAFQTLGAEKCLQLGARFLKTLHAIPADKCPFDRKLNVTLKLAKENVDAGLVDESDFDSDKRGLTGSDIYENLRASRPATEDLVFTHGDYCFPNIIVSNDQISGVVDLSRAGIADRYQDIALFLRSFRSNIGAPDLDLFSQQYGLKETLNFQKLEFYRALDEFF